MALLFLEEDPWILEHESCEKLQRDLMGQLTERQKFSRTSSKYAQISADIRLKLKQYNNEVRQLKQKLDIPLTTSTITAAESERRTRQVEVLMTKATQMQNMFDEQLSMKRMEERKDLLGSRTGDWEQYGDGPSNMGVQDMRDKQKQMLTEQEKGLENLSKIISRQKDIANTISNEVDYHNEIVEDIGIQVNRTDQRVRTETDRVEVVSRNDSTWVYWIVIIILSTTIIVVTSI